MNALFVGGPYMEVRTDGTQYWNLRAKELTARWDDGTFERYQIPPAADSDGASLPTLARSLRPSLVNRMFCAAFAHDAAYRGTLQRWDGSAWVPANLTLQQSNELLEALMFIESTSEAEREIVFQALQWFGGRAFREDRSIEGPHMTGWNSEWFAEWLRLARHQ